MFSLTGVRHIRKVGRGGIRDIFPFYEDTEVEIQTRECSGDLDGDFTVYRGSVKYLVGQQF